jgi:hypothetical protein
MEEALASHPGVEAAAVFPVSDGGRLAALVVPRLGAGEVDLEALTAELRRLLGTYQDDTALPRRWRYLPRLPADERGKRPIALLRAVAGLDPEDPWTPPPRLLRVSLASGRVSLRLAAEADHPAFAGHFPGHPILPGILLVHWAAQFAEGFLGVGAGCGEVANLKFTEPTFPGQAFELALESRPEGVAFEFSREGKPKASGMLRP